MIEKTNSLIMLAQNPIVSIKNVVAINLKLFHLMANFIKLAVFRYIGKHSKTLAFS